MIDLPSLDSTYTNLKVIEIKRRLKQIKPDINELSSLDVINLSLIFFNYLCECNDFMIDGNDLIFSYGSEDLIIDVQNLTKHLKFKNKLLYDFFVSSKDDENMMRDFKTVKELAGDINDF